MPDVVVVGDADTDIFLEVPELPTWDKGVVASRVFERPGGKGANTAAALSRLGTSVGFLGCVGDDRYGAIAKAGLVKHNVDTSRLQTIPGQCTYYCLILLDPTGEKAIVVIPTPIIYPTTEDVNAHSDYLLAARHVHTIGLQPARLVEALRIPRQAGHGTSVDLDSARAGLQQSEPLIREASIVFMNEQGAQALFGDKDLTQACHRLAKLGPEIVVITRGQRGALGFDGSVVLEVPSFPVQVRDTTGAGDCFSAAFIHAHLRGWDLYRKLVFACAAAALSTLEVGGQESLPTEDQVLAFLAENSIQF